MDDYCDEHKAHSEHLGRIDDRLDTQGIKVDTLSTTMAEVSTTLRQAMALNAKMDERISALESVPAHRWDVLLECMMSGIVGAVCMQLVTMLAH